MTLSKTQHNIIHLLEWLTEKQHLAADDGTHSLIAVKVNATNTSNFKLVDIDSRGEKELYVGENRVLMYWNATQEDLNEHSATFQRFGYQAEVIGKYLHIFTDEMPVDETVFTDRGGYLRKMFCTRKDGAFIPVLRKVSPCMWFFDGDDKLYNSRSSSSSGWSNLKHWPEEDQARIRSGILSNEEMMAFFDFASGSTNMLDKVMELWSNHTLKVRLGA